MQLKIHPALLCRVTFMLVAQVIYREFDTLIIVELLGHVSQENREELSAQLDNIDWSKEVVIDVSQVDEFDDYSLSWFHSAFHRSQLSGGHFYVFRSINDIFSYLQSHFQPINQFTSSLHEPQLFACRA